MRPPTLAFRRHRSTASRLLRQLEAGRTSHNAAWAAQKPTASCALLATINSCSDACPPKSPPSASPSELPRARSASSRHAGGLKSRVRLHSGPAPPQHADPRDRRDTAVVVVGTRGPTRSGGRASEGGQPRMGRAAALASRCSQPGRAPQQRPVYGHHRRRHGYRGLAGAGEAAATEVQGGALIAPRADVALRQSVADARASFAES